MPDWHTTRGCRGAIALPMGETLPELVEGRGFSIGNGAGRAPRNPGKPVKNGLAADCREKMDGRTNKTAVLI